MRNTEERVMAVMQRAREIKLQKRVRKGRIVMVSYAAACLIFIIGLSFAMPGIAKSMPGDERTYFGTAASIFDGGGGFGYVLIGLLSFVLGAGITILCYHIQMKNQRDHKDGEDTNG